MSQEDFENEYVHKFYSLKAKVFSESRVKPWPYTLKFISQYAKDHHIILDSGCGNGRQFIHENIIGLDLSYNLLLDAAKKKNIGLVQGNIHHLPFKAKTFDIVLSVAVIHHLSTEQRRNEAMLEMRRVLSDDGIALVYVWHKSASFRNKFTHIEGNNYFVNWKGENDYLRYYYLFDEDSLRDLCTINGFEVIECQREQESIYAVIKKSKCIKRI